MESPGEITTPESLSPEAERLNLWGEIVQKEARSLLGKYLSEALPQEPTELFFGYQPYSIGRFRGKHYIQIPKADYFTSKELLDDLERKKKADMAEYREGEQKRIQWLTDLSKKYGSGEMTREEFDILLDQGEPEDALAVIPPIEKQKADWEQPEKLVEGDVSSYSPDTWMAVHTLVHELIHQRQAELSPESFPGLSSPDLEQVDMDTIPRADLEDLLEKTHRANSRQEGGTDNMFYPVIEGMAVVGSYYVMGRLINDLTTSGQVEAASQAKKARDVQIRLELLENQRSQTEGKADSYSAHYLEGTDMMRKIYKRFGIEQTPRLMTEIDLTALKGITKGTLEYQRLMADPTLLPGLPKPA